MIHHQHDPTAMREVIGGQPQLNNLQMSFLLLLPIKQWFVQMLSWFVHRRLVACGC